MVRPKDIALAMTSLVCPVIPIRLLLIMPTSNAGRTALERQEQVVSLAVDVSWLHEGGQKPERDYGLKDAYQLLDMG
jgi:hypothetical protein